jgi:AraC-like DNA-binding protein
MDYRCDAAPGDKSYIELFPAHSISYVRQGSFGCCSRGNSYELIPGSLLIGHRGDEYQCTHDHHAGGDECLSFQLAAEFVDSIKANSKIWRVGAMPPLPELMILGELAQSAVQGDNDIGTEEVGLLLTQRFIDVLSGAVRSNKPFVARDRRRAVEAALWIDAHSHNNIGLDDSARIAGLSPFHFLRLFAGVFAVTPHQYLLRSRLRRAVHLLADDTRTITDIAFDAGFNDLSNFVRTFHRAAGMSPGRFRRGSHDQRKIFQDRLKPIV